MKVILWLLVVLAAVAAVVALLLLTPLGERPLTALFGVGERGAIDFEHLELTDRPNQFLICPPDLCAVQRHADSPLFAVPVERLRAAWRDLVASQPRTVLLTEDPDGQQADYLQRSARFRFPDIITVRFIALSPSQSTLAIYSRSLYGKSDLGVNRKRIEAWLKDLEQSL